MAESANLAFYAIVYSKGLVPKQRLQGALNRATLDGVPLETVLLESGAIKASDCVDALALRTRLGRSCSSCSGTTYLLPDQSDAEEKCEFCSAALVPKKVRKAESRAKAPEAKPAVREPRQPRSRRSTASRRVERARAARSSEGAPQALAGLEERVNALESADITELVTQAVESRLASLDLEGLVERAAREAAAGQGGGGGGGGGGGLGMNSGDILDPEQIAEDVAGKALALVQARVDNADLSGLYDKVTEIATERTLANVGSSGGGGGGAPAADLTQLRAEVSESAVQSALAAVSDQLASRSDSESGDEELRNALQALEDYLQQFDLSSLSDRLTAVEGAAGGGSTDTDDLVASIDALQMTLDDVQAKLSPLLGLDMRFEDLQAQVAEGATAAPAAAAIPADYDAIESRITESVSREMRERLDRDLEGLPDRIGQEAAAPVLAAIENRIEKLDLKGLPKRVADEATAEVLAAVREEVSAEAERAVADAAANAAGNGGGGAADQEKILQAVELRLSQTPPAEEIVQMATGEAIAAFEERLAEFSAGAGAAAGPDAEEIAQMATVQAMAAVEERLAEVGGASSSPGPSPDEIVQMAVGQAIAAVEERLLEISADSASPAAPAGPPPEEIVQMATAQAVAAFEERWAEVSAEASSETPVGGPSAEEVATIAAGQAMAAVEERLAAIEANAGAAPAGGGGGVDEDKVDAIARKIAMEVVESHAKLAGMGMGDGDPTATQILKRSQLAASYDHKKFIALAREVKNVKDALKSGGGGGGGGDDKALNDKADKADVRALAVQVTKCEDWIERLRGETGGSKPGGSSKPGGGAGSLSEILSSTEFKQVFDNKINQVLGYIKSDVVPKAVKKALESS